MPDTTPRIDGASGSNGPHPAPCCGAFSNVPRARAVARAIRVRLRPEEERRLAGARTVKPATYGAYLRGMFHLNKATPADFPDQLRRMNLPPLQSDKKAADVPPPFMVSGRQAPAARCSVAPRRPG